MAKANEITVSEFFINLEQENAENIDRSDLTELVPEWFLQNNLSQGELYAWHVGDNPNVQRETEKAMLLSRNSDFGRVTLWCPKSLLNGPSENDIENAANEDINWAYGDYLRFTLKAAGVKVGNIKKWSKLTALLHENDVKFMSREDFANTNIGEISAWSEISIKY